MTSGMRVQSKSHDTVIVIQNKLIKVGHNFTETGPAIPLLAKLVLEPQLSPTYVAGVNLFPVLAEMNNLMQNSVRGWKMRITNRKRKVYLRNGKQMVGGSFFVDYLSVRSKDEGQRHRPTKKIEVVNLELFSERPPDTPIEQLSMTLALLEVCRLRGVKLRGTRGGTGGALLKASEHWEKGRHAAPKFVNDAARKVLPGNFYSIGRRKSVETIPFCYYVDQDASHHSIASAIPIPHPHFIRARGKYKQALKGENRRWCDPGTPVGQEYLKGEQVGAILAKVRVGHLPPKESHLYPPWAQKGQGTYYVWLWTPELRLFHSGSRIELDSFVAAFSACTRDPVIPEYAKWSLNYLRENRGSAAYTKSTLLSAYGMLAFNSSGGKPTYRYWGGSEFQNRRTVIPLAGEVLERKLQIPDTVQFTTVNVIARGLIEAETRTRSIEYAKELHTLGFEVPQIYADGILVASHQLPFIRQGWRISHELTRVYLPRPNIILSDQIRKLPGTPKSEDEMLWEDIRVKAQRVIKAEGVKIPSNSENLPAVRGVW